MGSDPIDSHSCESRNPVGGGITMDSGSSPEWERKINVFCYQIQKYVCDLIYSWQ